jgi:hypothetical protein
MNTQPDWLELCRQEFNRRFYFDDVGRVSLASPPASDLPAVPCASDTAKRLEAASIMALHDKTMTALKQWVEGDAA